MLYSVSENTDEFKYDFHLDTVFTNKVLAILLTVVRLNWLIRLNRKENKTASYITNDAKTIFKAV